MTQLTESCSVDILKLYRQNPHSDKTDRQLLGGCTKSTPLSTSLQPFKHKTDIHIPGGCTKTTPLEPHNENSVSQLVGGCTNTAPLEQLCDKIYRKVFVG